MNRNSQELFDGFIRNQYSIQSKRPFYVFTMINMLSLSRSLPLDCRYRMNNGTVYNGYTFEFASKIRLIVDANGHWYWAEFSENELNSSRPFLKSVLPGE